MPGAGAAGRSETDPERGDPGSSLGAAIVYCDNCGKETPHRILRLRGAEPGATRTVRGVARCRECRWTHPFVSTESPTSEVAAIVSQGSTTARRTLELAPAQRLRVGEALPGVEPPVVVRKLELHGGGRASEAAAREVRTVWGVVEGPRLVRVAVLEGPRSSTEKVAAAPGARWEVGGELRLANGPVVIVALRARSRTWRHPGDAFPAHEVTVVYGRRSVSPPAGRSDWRRGRGTPSSRASSISRAARSRSSPGASRKRTAPRARRADGGATERSSSPS